MRGSSCVQSTTFGRALCLQATMLGTGLYKGEQTDKDLALMYLFLVSGRSCLSVILQG